MNQSYGRLVSRAAIAATVMASSLLLIKIFAWWYTGSVSILAALVDSLMDIAASLTNLLVVGFMRRWARILSDSSPPKE